VLYIGLMSGTSADGIDGVLVDLTDDPGSQRPNILATCSVDYSPGIKEEIEAAIRLYPDLEAGALRRLDDSLAEDFARAAQCLVHDSGVEPARVAAIGSHGQTVYHGPGDDPPVSVQLGSPARIAALTGLTTVGDFRANDLRAGGQGAPLAPAFHNAVFRRPGTDRIIMNIGGIANLTGLPAEPSTPVVGFDSGPGNTLMDRWCHEHTGDRFDLYGRWAASGNVCAPLAKALLADPYFAMSPPKSTGREYFNLPWLKRRYPGWADEKAADVQATLLEVTARSIASAAGTALDGGGPFEMYVCGGGARNTALMDRLEALIEGSLSTTGALGVPPERVEGCAFAWLAHRRIHSLPGNLPSVTGACGEVLLGEIFRPS